MMDAERIVKALAKHPGLLAEVTDLLNARKPEIPSIKYSAWITAPIESPSDLFAVITLIIPADAPTSYYAVKVTFQSEPHLSLFLNGVDTHASGNAIYMEKLLRLAPGDVLSLRTGIVPSDRRRITEARIHAESHA